MRDYQKQRVYNWQEAAAPMGFRLAFADCQAYVNVIWEAAGLKWPPLVVPLDKRNTTVRGKASREKVYLPEVTYQRVVIHEVAHSMIGTIDGHSDGHGPEFVGMYMKLLDRHMSVSMPKMLYLLSVYKVDYDLFAKPWSGR